MPSLGADLPFKVTRRSNKRRRANAKKLAAAGAEFVKAEGGREILPQIRAIIAAGIPFCGHLGMLPQHVLEEGGYRVKGKDPRVNPETVAWRMPKALGKKPAAFAIVTELGRAGPGAYRYRRAISIPTIGIGSGPDCDGQILVTFQI